MKKISGRIWRNIGHGLLFFISVFPYYGCGNKIEQSNYQVKGRLANSSKELIYLVDINSSALKNLDSVYADEKGEFAFTKKVPEIGFYSIQISSSNFATVVLDSSAKITFEGDAKNLRDGYRVSGSKECNTYIKLNDYTKVRFKKMEELRNSQDSIRRVYEAYMNTTTDPVRGDSLSKVLEPIFNKYSDDYRKLAEDASGYIKKFIDDNTSAFASLAAVQMLSPERDINYFIKVSDALVAKYPNVKNLKDFQAYVQKEKTLAIGMPAPEITMNDKDGKSLSLSSLKGKIVIVDFWASWCKPCRAANPYVVGLYNKYKSKGLDVFSVSLDFNKEAWLKAIDQDKLVWKNHVTDLKQWQSPVVQLYGFEGIPFTCLIDKQGNIAGKNLQGPMLEEKIKELLGK
ncbi:MAG TPA: TlpA disulfide reductase family protein [Bacteroidia bacterium]